MEVVATPSVVWRFPSTGRLTHTPRKRRRLKATIWRGRCSLWPTTATTPLLNSLTGGGPLYYYPVSASGARSADPDLVPIYRYFNPMYGDYLYTTDSTEAQTFPCVAGYCAYARNGYCYAPVPPNCYLLMEPVYGYVGE